eukprot:jgi/Psemu1/8996/gm1.8996_g
MTSYSVIPFKFDFDPESLENIEYKHTSTTDGISETSKVKLYDNKFSDRLRDYSKLHHHD